MDHIQTLRSSEQPADVTFVAAGLTEKSIELVVQSLPECHILESRPDSWRTIRFCKLVGPVILLVDFEFLAELRSKQVPAVEYLSTVEVLALSHACDEDVYRVALLSGCSGVIERDKAAKQLREVVAAIQAGDLWYPRNVLAALARRWMLDQSISRKKLTEREEEILRLLGMDKKNQAIADELFISRETVRWHLRTLYAKIGVSNRSEARQYALKHQQDVTVPQ